MFHKTSNYTVYTIETNQIIDYRIELGKSVSQIASGEKDIIYRQNATFAWLDKGAYKPIGYVIKDGKLIQTTTSASKWSAFIVPKNGRPYIGQLDLNKTSDFKLAFQSTPQILKNGQVYINSSSEGTPPDVLGVTKRSAIGIKANGIIVLVTTAVPYSLNDLAKLMISFGCTDVLNLDGGGSVTSNYMNEKPVSNERPVSAAIVVKQNKQSGVDPMKPILIIDAGHGGNDPGATNGALKEKDMTLQISNYQYGRLQQLGVPVALTRTKDETLDPTPRAKKVKESGAKYCISNHINAGGGDGVEAIHSIYSDGKLAKKLTDAVVAEGQNFRRIFTRTLPTNAKQDYYYMQRDTGAVDTTIIEYGFIDSTKDDVVQLQRDWKLYAEAVVKAFCEYTGYKYTPPTSPPSTTNNPKLESALKVIQNKGGTNSPEYWIKNAIVGGQVQGDYAASLIQNVADIISKLDKEIESLKSTTPISPSKPDPKPEPEKPVEPKPVDPKPIETPKPWDQVLKLATDTSVYFQVGGKNGTGVLLKDGYILTAKHVVHPDAKMKVQTKSGKWHDITFISEHPEKDVDIAICKIDNPDSTLPYLHISSKGIKSGQKLIAVGHSLNNKWKSKEGIVCREHVGGQPWEFDCSIPLDNDDSGSGTVNEYGEIVGIAVQKTSVGVKIGSVSQSVRGSEVVNLSHTKISDWLKECKIIE
ncbi:phosphodiester glycosidase family protein [Brevibacillus sp. NRS-1366]|uniref:phosphodiester glycosidase family protein n=1 Tax=Brevibacillus sp. NRS-1366 TaxID=3233899 RepID=UPI003D1982EA